MPSPIPPLPSPSHPTSPSPVIFIVQEFVVVVVEHSWRLGVLHKALHSRFGEEAPVGSGDPPFQAALHAVVCRGEHVFLAVERVEGAVEPAGDEPTARKLTRAEGGDEGGGRGDGEEVGVGFLGNATSFADCADVEIVHRSILEQVSAADLLERGRGIGGRLGEGGC